MKNPDFNVKKLADIMVISQPTLYRRVKTLTNFTISEFIQGVRLKRAAELLRSRRYTVQDIAEMVGYNDLATFRKHFVDFYGTTPSTFCNKMLMENRNNYLPNKWAKYCSTCSTGASFSNTFLSLSSK